jgi:type VI secretion system protein ImpA
MDLVSPPISLGDASPSGANLEYDPLFTALELAAQPREERQIGDEVIEAEPPDYKDVSEKALAVLERSHDLRAAVYLAHAQLRLNGLPEFAGALDYVRGCLEDFWESCHPQLDADDDDDPTMRVNAVRALVDKAGVLQALTLTPLASSRMFPRYSLRDIAIAKGETSPPADMAEPPDLRAINAALLDTDPEQIRALRAAAVAAQAAADAIAGKFDEMIPGLGPDLTPLQSQLRKIHKHLAEVQGESAEADEPASEPGETTGGAPAQRGVGGVNSRSDVIAALDLMIGFYERNEPSSPVPLLLTRAKRLVNADFLTIIRELAPSGMDNVNLIGGLESE